MGYLTVAPRTADGARAWFRWCAAHLLLLKGGNRHVSAAASIIRPALFDVVHTVNRRASLCAADPGLRSLRGSRRTHRALRVGGRQSACARASKLGAAPEDRDDAKREVGTSAARR